MAERRRAVAEMAESETPKKTTTATTMRRKLRDPVVARESEHERSVMADDGALYVLALADRVVLDVLAYQDEGLLAFIRIDGEVVAELPVAGQA
ncbi:hypothetical protein [Chondromyces crocatus]|uniref:Uncharacterized protein n=1 Tax=Chondromyces crocatus TaxID=52 RepID=A0A0K1EK33_CHOCO|nr:hypothetical protein [Chondromyces crocatus]AKT40958.1 uncharacterized protein CMC5_051150 [Chondromyces crocatus]